MIRRCVIGLSKHCRVANRHNMIVRMFSNDKDSKESDRLEKERLMYIQKEVNRKMKESIDNSFKDTINKELGDGIRMTRFTFNLLIVGVTIGNLIYFFNRKMKVKVDSEEVKDVDMSILAQSIKDAPNDNTIRDIDREGKNNDKISEQENNGDSNGGNVNDK